MKRKQVFQFSNQAWYPSFLKRDMYEFMSWFVGKVNAAKPFLPVIEEGLNHAPLRQIVNVDSKIGAGFETVKDLIAQDIPVVHMPIQEFTCSQQGLYLFVNSFHKLKPEQARLLLTQIAKSQNAVVVVEGNNDSLWQVVGMTVFVPLSVILSAPFVKPFRLTRLIFTYLIPILPVVTMLDGFLALFKLYNPKDLNELVSTVSVPNYTWQSAKAVNGRGGKIIYLTGWPKKAAN